MHLRLSFIAVLALAVASAARAEAVRLPGGAELREVDFERHVAPLLVRSGCSAGACHGSFQGKGGLRLSLFGHAPGKDYLALTRDGLGRRIDRADPDRSLLLLKPTGRVAHEGGRRFAADSWQYGVLRAWVTQGAKWRPGSGVVRRLEVEPGEHAFAGPGESVALRVTAEYDDGSRADVTPFCDIRPKDEGVAVVSSEGRVSGRRTGDTAVIVSYRGNLTAAHVLVPRPAGKDFVNPPVPEANFIDREVFAKLRQLNVVPSELCDDATFLRRVSIDVVGTLPAPDEVREFLADRRPDKRGRAIDRLLASPMHAALWATRFSDVTGNNVDVMDGSPETRARRAKMWHDWLRRRFADNVPYDRIVRGILCATSRDGEGIDAWTREEAALADQGFVSDYAKRRTLDLFWRRTAGDDFFPLEQMAELTASAFLGVRLECAQCHKHPFDRWTQADYRAFANVFGTVKYGSSNDLRAATARLLDERRRAGLGEKPVPRLREVFVSDTAPRRLPDPETNGPLPAKALGGPAIPLDGDPRERLFDWLARPDNPFFARAFVNRVWAHYFGAGLVEPVDGFSVANPPSNDRLLDALAADFVSHGYDIRRLERLVLTSRTYQLSATPNATNAQDDRNFSHARVRRLLAEVVIDVLGAALGTPEDFGKDAPPGARAIEVAPNRVRDAHLARAFRIFGRPARAALCDCERPREPALPQTLFLMTDEPLLKRMREGRLKGLLAGGKSDREIVEELFLATLSRPPDGGEERAALDHVRAKGDRRAGFTDMMWALINTREFILNH
jgi:hypothetical protein